MAAEKPYRNLMEDFVEQAIDECFEKEPNVCTCDRCRNNIAALALNQLKPVYVSTDKGEVYSRISEELDSQLKADLALAVYTAIQKVAKNPRH